MDNFVIPLILVTIAITVIKSSLVQSEYCLKNFLFKRNMIIIVPNTRDKGVPFLKQIHSFDRDDCLQYCCNFVGCDVFVFEETAVGNCYLFNCNFEGSTKCLFIKRTNFTSGVASIGPESYEFDIKNLNKSSNDQATNEYSSKNQWRKDNSELHKVIWMVSNNHKSEENRILVKDNEIHKKKLSYDNDVSSGQIEEPVGAIVAIFLAIVILFILFAIALNRLNRIATKSNDLYKLHLFDDSNQIY